MGLNTYPDLIASIDNWLDRDDLVNLTPDFISLAELRINRKLRVIDMEATAKTPLIDSQYAYSLPCDFASARNIYFDDNAETNLEYVAPDAFVNYNAGTAYIYTISDGQIKVKTLNGTNLVVEYFKKYPHLSSENQTNWMTENAYDALLYGALLEAEAWLQTDERLPTWIAAFDRSMSDLNEEAEEGRFSGDVLRIRAG